MADNSAESALGYTQSTAGHAVTKTGDAAMSTVGYTQDTLGSAVQHVEDTASAAARRIKESTSAALGYTQDTAHVAVKKLQETAHGTAEYSQQTVKKVSDTAAHSYQQAYQGTMEALGSTTQYAKDKSSEGAQVAEDTAKKAGEKTQDAAHYGKESAGGLYQSVLETVDSAFGYTKDKAHETAQVAQDKTKDTAKYAEDTAKAGYEKVWFTFWQCTPLSLSLSTLKQVRAFFSIDSIIQCCPSVRCGVILFNVVVHRWT